MTEMTGTPRMPRESRGDGNMLRDSGGCERNAEMKAHFSALLLLLGLHRAKRRIRQRPVSSAIATTAENNSPALIFRNYQ